MAKKPTTDVKNEDAGVPSQPWAQGTAKADSSNPTDATANDPALATTGEIPQGTPPADAQEPAEGHPADLNAGEGDEHYAQLSDDDRALVDGFADEFDKLSAEDKDEFLTFMREQAVLKMKQLTRSADARAMEVNLIDSAEHYGKHRDSGRRQRHLEA